MGCSVGFKYAKNAEGVHKRPLQSASSQRIAMIHAFLKVGSERNSSPPLLLQPGTTQHNDYIDQIINKQ